MKSTFIDISNPEKNNIVTTSIYKHPNMNHNELNEFYLNGLFERLSKENKTFFHFANFNINLHYDQGTTTNKFIDSLSSQLFLSHILQPTRGISDTKTWIDYVF